MDTFPGLFEQSEGWEKKNQNDKQTKLKPTIKQQQQNIYHMLQFPVFQISALNGNQCPVLD